MQIKYFKVLYLVPHGNFAMFGGRLTNPKESWLISEVTGNRVVPEHDIYEVAITNLNDLNRLIEYCTKSNFIIAITEIGASKFKLIPRLRNCPCNFIKKEDQ